MNVPGVRHVELQIASLTATRSTWLGERKAHSSVLLIVATFDATETRSDPVASPLFNTPADRSTKVGKGNAHLQAAMHATCNNEICSVEIARAWRWKEGGVSQGTARKQATIATCKTDLTFRGPTLRSLGGLERTHQSRWASISESGGYLGDSDLKNNDSRTPDSIK